MEARPPAIRSRVFVEDLKREMNLVLSDAPEVSRCIASGGVRASRRWPALVYGAFLNAVILLIALTVRLSISTRAAAWLGVPLFLAWNAYVLWCTKSDRRNWVVAGCADRVYIRLFMARGRGVVQKAKVLVLEASDITSMSTRTVEVFLYGPKPKIVEWLVIEPAQGVAESISDRILPSPRPFDPAKQLQVVNQGERLITRWKWCHPVLGTFLQRLARECPSVTIGNEERSELDLNGIWSGISMNLTARQRQMLVEAIRLGFGPKCTRLLSRHKYISFRESQGYLAELVREEAGREQPAE